MTTGDWCIATVVEAIAAQQPAAPAITQGDRRISWADLGDRSRRLGAFLCGQGLARGDTVVQYLRNCPEYLESVMAALGCSLVPVNTNYRYGDDELAALWTDADARAVVFHGAFSARVETVRKRLPGVRSWIWVDDGSGSCPAWAVGYEDAVAKGGEPPPWPRSGEDLLLLYTGGTTGLPKGVMWEQDTLIRILTGLCPVPVRDGMSLDDFLAGVRQSPQRPVLLALPPLMHGTGLFTTLANLLAGGCVVLPATPSFDPVAVWETIERERVHSIVVVGDAFARPLADALDAAPGRFDLSSLRMAISSGVMWSDHVRERFLRHLPGIMLVDTLGSSEAVGVGSAVSTAGQAAPTGRFVAGPDAVVLDEDGRPVRPGSGQAGRLALRGLLPRGYHKDPAATARTFPVIDGVRYSIPGDWATVDTDGSIVLLGRGSVCINTGGEKVYPEEVEQVIATHPAVADAVVVGVPDDRFGEAVAAVVEPHGGAGIDADELIAYVKQRLAAYKAPKRIVVVDTIGRGPNGKADYQQLRRVAAEREE